MKSKATKYRYMTNSTPRQKSLGVSSDYQFNWFIGGADTCQGDSGGPIWRNIKVTSLVGGNKTVFPHRSRIKYEPHYLEWCLVVLGVPSSTLLLYTAVSRELLNG